MSALLKIPPKSVLSPALVESDFSWFWNPWPLFAMLPWQIVGNVTDFIGPPLALTGTPLLKSGVAGRFLEYDGEQYNERDSFPTLSYPFTMIVVPRSHPPATLPSNNFFLALVDSSVDNKVFLLRRRRSGGSAGFHGASHRNTTFGESTIDIPTGLGTFDPMVIAGVYANSTSAICFADGQQGAEDTTSVPIFTPNRVSIGRIGDSTPGNSDRDCGVYWAAVLPQAINFDQFLQLEADPGGPFRMRDEAVFFALGTTFFEAPAMTAIGVAALTQVLTHLETPAMTAVGSASLARVATFSRTFSMTATGVAALARVATFFRSFTMTATGVPLVVKTIGMTKVMTAVGVAALAQVATFSRAFSMTAVGVAALSKVTTFLQTATMVALGVAGFAKTFIAGGAPAVKKFIRHWVLNLGRGL